MKILQFYFYSFTWSLSKHSMLILSSVIKKSASVPFHLSRGCLGMKDAPRPFFSPKDIWAHCAWPTAWMRRRRRSRMHSSGTLHHRRPIACCLTWAFRVTSVTFVWISPEPGNKQGSQGGVVLRSKTALQHNPLIYCFTYLLTVNGTSCQR